MSDVTLDWSSAEVSDGTLELALQGEVPKAWKESFERTVALLGGGVWGEIQVKKGRVRVQHVTEGEENRLHHFLESVVLQANAAHGGTEPEHDEEHDSDEEEPEEPQGPDAEMTERFREFGAGTGD